MKNQFIKSALLLLGVTVLATSCVKSDDLAGMEELQTTTLNNKLIAEKTKTSTSVYTMQKEVATSKQTILQLQADSNQIQFLSTQYKLQYSVDSAKSVSHKLFLANLQAANTASNYQSSIDALVKLVGANETAYEQKKLASIKASNSSDSASVVTNNAYDAWQKTINDGETIAIQDAAELVYTNAGLRSDLLAKAASSASAATSAAWDIYSTSDDNLNNLKDGKSSITDVIDTYTQSVSDDAAGMQEATDKLSQLSSGVNTNTNKLVAEFIAAEQQKIKALEALIAAYKI